METTYADIIAHKHLTVAERQKDLASLRKWKAEENERKFCGNPTLYHYQLANLLETRIGKHPLLRELMDDPAQKERLVRDVEKRARTGTMANRIFEAYRVNKGACVFFKPSTAKFLYKRFGATHVLDPTAGWGGRMLGAWALGIAYTGIDQNVALRPAYDAMRTDLGADNLHMLWGSCLDQDFSAIDYDFVLTSPPYVNLELYEGMTPYDSKRAFYEEFLIPLLNKCRQHVRRGGRVAFNISPMMYHDLLSFGYDACREEYDLLQQKRAGRNKEDKIYIW